MAMLFKFLKPRLPVFHPLGHPYFAGVLLGRPVLPLSEESALPGQP